MYAQIRQNRQRTWILLILMNSVIGVLCVSIGILAGLDSTSAIIIGTLFTTVYALVSYYASASITLASSGAQKVNKQDAPELVRLVENLAITNGLPTPNIYIINDESPNAFATGRDPQHASVAFTTGLLRILNKQELEGVAAHELSHIKNEDIKVMTITVVLVGAIMLIADILLRNAFHGDRKEGLPVLAIIGFILAILSPLFAEIIKLAISREREYLADASAALTTRYPQGLVSALKKLSENSAPLKNANHATAHLFITNPFKEKRASFLQKIFSTHPPMEERIKRLESIEM